MAQLIRIPRQRVLTHAVRSQAGALMYVYDSGTLDPITTYADAGLTAELPHPIQADAYGTFPPVYVPDSVTDYKIRLTGSSGQEISTDDFVPIGNQSSFETDVRSWGAIGDGVTDDTAAIQAAIDFATQNRGVIPVAPPLTFKCSGTIYVTCSVNFEGATFDFGTNYTGKGIVVSATKSTTPEMSYLLRALIRLPHIVQNKSARGWGGVAGSVGVYVVNNYECRIWYGEVAYFETGIEYIGDATNSPGMGCVYNAAYLQKLTTCKVQLLLTNIGYGWCNENQFHGGRFHQDSAENAVPGTRTAGTRQVSIIRGVGAHYGGPNNNTFYSCSLEGVVDEYAVYIENCLYNTFYTARWESGSTANKTIYITGAQARYNVFHDGYGLFQDLDGMDGPHFIEAGGAYGNMTIGPIGIAVNGGYFENPVFGAAHHSSGGYPAFASYHYTADPRSRWAYTASMSGTGLHVKNGMTDVDTTDPDSANWVIYDKVLINNMGSFRLGSGAAPYDVEFARQAANLLAMSAGDSFKVDGTWNGGTIRLGNYYLWVDGSGKLRMKSGAPTSDTDAGSVIVGTQT